MAQHQIAVVLLSGGLDSTTTLAVAKSKAFEPYCLSFNYGQRHKYELKAAREIAKYFDVKEHLILDISLDKIGGSALTDEIEVPKSQSVDPTQNVIPVTYVPARNTIFLSFALAWSETLACSNIFIGVNAMDYSGYPDCRPEYINAFENMANLGTKAGVTGQYRLKIQAPLIHMTKSEIIQTGHNLGVDYSLTFSCYDPSADGLACGQCDSCLLRIKGFRESGISDPTRYAG